ncbi:uncharacterized protein LOC112688000 [Sipha flava]|uniref:Uncharacterized protein LOC112688000 n=1 Tax=Sipha flava TaxID=143950 RepID=A0A8B8G0N7_9HEMI|nr:uncharacterized protein LOC112688000 [Sipha flava]
MKLPNAPEGKTLMEMYTKNRKLEPAPVQMIASIQISILKILQWNPNGFYSKLDEINLLLNKYCPISICLQETNFINDKVCSLNNYTTYYKNRTNAGRVSGGVAIYVNSNYHSEEIIINTNLEVIAVNVLIKNSITICNLYLPNYQNFEQSDIQNIINQLPSPYIILGDFNSHSPLWGCSTLDSRGSKIEQTLYSNNDLNILNSGQATRVSVSTGHFTIIDLSFSSATITPYIYWDVIPELSSNPKEITNQIGQFFYSNSSNTSLNPDFLKFKETKELITLPSPTTTTSQGSILNDPITMSELNSSLEGKISNSCGPDNIQFLFFQNISIKDKILLLELYNNVWSSGIIPSLWKNAIKNALPLFLRKLNWYVQRFNLLSPNQHGFRKSHSTSDCYVKIETEILESYANKQTMIIISLDLQKAYDTVWRHRVLNILRNWYINGQMLQFITSFLKERSFQVRINEHMSDKFDLKNGVPQGSPLSILLFQAAINNLPDEISHPVKLIMFADDTHIYLKGKNIKSMTRQLQDCLNDLSKWCFHSGFIFSPEKTKCIMFTKKKQSSKPKLFLGNTPLPFVNNIKILGLIFDSKLTWKPHISKTKTTTTKSINIIKTSSHAEWGAEINILIKLYRSLVRSKLDYGSICYTNANPNILKTIDIIHNSGLRVAAGAFRSSPIPSILSISGEPPLHVRRIKLALNYISRILSSPKNSTLPFLTQNRFANTFCSNLNLKKPLDLRMLYEISHNNIDPNLIIKRECSVVPPWRVPTFLVNTSLADHSKKETLNVIYKNLFNEIMDSFPSKSQIYTDASKINSGVAIAIINGEQSISYKLPDHNSIYTAEYFALLEGVHLAIQLPDSTINICTDSLSALNNLKYNLHSSILAIIISNIIEKANKNIRFIWTPGHCGIDGNEKADKVAREAVNNPLTEIRTYSSLIDIHRYVNTYCTDLWESEWRRTPSNKLRKIKNTTEYWPKPHTSNRKDEVAINRLRIGHSKMSHGHLMHREEPAMINGIVNSPPASAVVVPSGYGAWRTGWVEALFGNLYSM